MMSETIKLVMVKRNMNGKELAEALGCSSQNVYALLKKDNWSEEQLRNVAEALNCDLHMSFELRDTHEQF
ncbi:helix-turn-helix domain-containing protein [Butyrivibrio sp. AE3004]|uniref:helix-turn-helix domain-containing protein n=1 Tax=Butyrivibrio sp. AE3004 TaxID=1506994 RepID=UPI00068A720D|nr:helix-turn-helix transcriptional regulator [Butyrivibrio sp. AE3004]